LLADAAPDSTFLAFYLVDPADEPVTAYDRQFRARLGNRAGA
jgi:hypothetical protein